ncbi:MAG: stage III sporulation protein AF [Clostridia bacterium]|nr:stage III sporulation protein AF [Clostridia bacterium]
MSGYILSVIGVVLIAAILTAILPEGKTNGVIKSVMKVVCVFTIVSPVFEYLGGAENINSEGIFEKSVINEDVSFIDYCSKISVENVAKELEASLETEFSVQVSVTLEWRYKQETTDILVGSYENDKIEIVKATVALEVEPDAETKEKIIGFLKETGIGEVEIV